MRRRPPSFALCFAAVRVPLGEDPARVRERFEGALRALGIVGGTVAGRDVGVADWVVAKFLAVVAPDGPGPVVARRGVSGEPPAVAQGEEIWLSDPETGWALVVTAGTMPLHRALEAEFGDVRVGSVLSFDEGPFPDSDGMLSVGFEYRDVVVGGFPAHESAMLAHTAKIPVRYVTVPATATTRATAIVTGLESTQDVSAVAFWPTKGPVVHLWANGGWSGFQVVAGKVVVGHEFGPGWSPVDPTRPDGEADDESIADVVLDQITTEPGDAEEIAAALGLDVERASALAALLAEPDPDGALDRLAQILALPAEALPALRGTLRLDAVPGAVVEHPRSFLRSALADSATGADDPVARKIGAAGLDIEGARRRKPWWFLTWQILAVPIIGGVSWAMFTYFDDPVKGWFFAVLCVANAAWAFWPRNPGGAPRDARGA
jgi:hypothetical protein